MNETKGIAKSSAAFPAIMNNSYSRIPPGEERKTIINENQSSVQWTRDAGASCSTFELMMFYEHMTSSFAADIYVNVFESSGKSSQ